METLADRIARDGPLTELDAVGWAIRLAKRIEIMHALGVTHGSVSPQCVLIEGKDRAAKATLVDVRRTPNSLAFHSPERAAGAGLSQADDTWALACTLYTALTGSSPYSAPTDPEIKLKIAASSPAPLAVFDAGDDDLQRVLEDAFAKDIAARICTISALRLALEEWHPDPNVGGLPSLEDEDTETGFEDGDEDYDERTIMRPAPKMFADISSRGGRSPAGAIPAPRSSQTGAQPGAIPAPRASQAGPIPAPRSSQAGAQPGPIPAPRSSQTGAQPGAIPAPRSSQTGAQPGAIPAPRASQPGAQLSPFAEPRTGPAARVARPGGPFGAPPSAAVPPPRASAPGAPPPPSFDLRGPSPRDVPSARLPDDEDDDEDQDEKTVTRSVPETLGAAFRQKSPEAARSGAFAAATPTKSGAFRAVAPPPSATFDDDENPEEEATRMMQSPAALFGAQDAPAAPPRPATDAHDDEEDEDQKTIMRTSLSPEEVQRLSAAVPHTEPQQPYDDAATEPRSGRQKSAKTHDADHEAEPANDPASLAQRGTDEPSDPSDLSGADAPAVSGVITRDAFGAPHPSAEQQPPAPAPMAATSVTNPLVSAPSRKRSIAWLFVVFALLIAAGAYAYFRLRG